MAAEGEAGVEEEDDWLEDEDDEDGEEKQRTRVLVHVILPSPYCCVPISTLKL
jgi:hypothetical protein